MGWYKLLQPKFQNPEGLQQGTVNSPILFVLYTCALLSLFQLNTENLKAIAFADDLAVYLSGRSPKKIQTGLQQTLDKIDKFFQTWNLRINFTKCESILFRRTTYFLSRGSKDGINTFQLTGVNPGTNTIVNVPHNTTVKYLGVHIDHLLRLNKHINIELNKATAAFKANNRLFHCKQLNNKVKIICYQLLIRPIISYAAPIWWNISASYMEKIRIFERKCIRTCLKLYRSRETNYKKHISNEVLYNLDDIPRIDNYTIKITRDYFEKMPKIDNNELKKIHETSQ